MRNDKNELFAYRRNPDSNQYQGWIPKTIEDVESFIESIAKQIDFPKTWFQFVIIEKETQRIVGDLGLHFFDNENKQVEIGCTLSKEFQNKGYATESLIRVIDYLFQDLNKHRIIASIDPNNLKSVKLLERMGFRKEAHFVESLFIHGKWVDDVIYALLEKDWEQLNRGEL